MYSISISIARTERALSHGILEYKGTGISGETIHIDLRSGDRQYQRQSITVPENGQWYITFEGVTAGRYAMIVRSESYFRELEDKRKKEGIFACHDKNVAIHTLIIKGADKSNLSLLKTVSEEDLLSREKIMESLTKNEPKFAQLMEEATTDEERQQLITNHAEEKKRFYEKQFGDTLQLDSDTGDTDPAIIVDPDVYKDLQNAHGNDIKNVVALQLKVIQDLNKQIDSWDNYDIASFIFGNGVFAIGGACSTYFITHYSEEIGSMLGDAIAGTIAAVGISALASCVAVVFVALIVYPIYLILKPAVCVTLLLNELTTGIEWKDDYNVHGKPNTHVKRLQASFTSISKPEKNKLYAGFICTTKRDNAMVGVTYGFVYNPKGPGGDSVNLGFGTECPLMHRNRALCGFVDAKSAANAVDNSDPLECSATNDKGINISIKCNSESGSIAYYIAHVQQS